MPGRRCQQKESSSRAKSSEKAAQKLRFTEKQAAAILEMRLYKLIGLEIEALQAEYAETHEEHCTI